METVYIPAYVQRPRTGRPNKVIIHDPGDPLPVDVSAIGVANFNATPPDQRHPNGVGGYHVEQDGTHHVISAADDHRVNGAAGANDDGLHLCMCDYTHDALVTAAFKVRAWCANYQIPMVKKDAAAFNRHEPGIYGHVDVEQAIGVQGGHTDPRDFPWPEFMQLVTTVQVPPAPQPPKVKPMHSPPIHVIGGIAADVAYPKGGAIIVGRYGHIYALGGASYIEGPVGPNGQYKRHWINSRTGKPRQVSKVKIRRYGVAGRKIGLTITATDGGTYNYPDGT